MSRTLLMTTEEKGHLNPMVGVAQHLLRLGHDVGWACLPHLPDRVAEMGVEPVSVDAPEPESDEDFATDGAELAELVRTDDPLFRWLRRLLIGNLADCVPPTREAFRGWDPDAVAVDAMLYQGIIAAHLEELPYACVSSTLNVVVPDAFDGIYREHMNRLADDRRTIFRAFSMDPTFRLTACLSPHCNIVFAPPAYVDEAGDVPPNTHLVGPSFPPGDRGDEVEFPWEELDDRPTVYASFGSQIYYQPECFERIARATEPLDVQVVLSCGELADTEWADDLPDHVLPKSYVPQRQLLDRVAVMVTHGGANSVREAITAGVPLLISPVCNDQPVQACFVRKTGVGRRLDVYEADDADVRRDLEALLADDAPERRTVAEMSEAFRNHDGAVRTAELVEGLAP